MAVKRIYEIINTGKGPLNAIPGNLLLTKDESSGTGTVDQTVIENSINAVSGGAVKDYVDLSVMAIDDSKVNKSGIEINLPILDDLNRKIGEIGHANEIASFKGEAGVLIDSPSASLSSLIGYQDYLVGIGLGGQLIPVKKENVGSYAPISIYSTPQSLAQNVVTKLGAIINTTKILINPTLQWSINITNNTNQNSIVKIRLGLNSVLTGSYVVYSVTKNATLVITGAAPYANTINSGTEVSIYIESNKNSTVNSVTIKLDSGIQSATIDQTIIQNSTNAVSGGAVYSALTDKANLYHLHSIADIGNLQNELNLKAPLLSPVFTGTPTAPTATAGTNTTQVATTAFVTNADAENVKLIGNQFISGYKTFNLYAGFVQGIVLYNNSLLHGSLYSPTRVGDIGGHFAFASDTKAPVVISTELLNNLSLVKLKVPNQSGIIALTSNNVSLTATSFVISGGMSSEFLKADGSTDNNSYATTAQLHNAVTLGTPNGLSLANQVLSLALASTNTTGALSSTDWNDFNNKVSNASHTGDVTGSTILTLVNVNANAGTFGDPATIPQFTVNYKGLITEVNNIPIQISESQVTNLANSLNDKQNISQKNQANGYAGLGADGKLLSAQLPSITISDTFVVASQAAMLAVVAETGDVVVRTDLNKSFILKGTNSTVLADWQELLTPTSSVVSVFGRQGSVSAQVGDYTADQITETAGRKFQTANQYNYNDATSSIQTQLNSKQSAGSYEIAFAKNTAFNKNFGTTSNTVAEGNDSRIINGQTAFSWGNHSGKYVLNDTNAKVDPNTQFQSSSYRFDPNANNPTNEHYSISTYGNNSNVTAQLASRLATGESYVRAYNSSWSSWRKILDSVNFSSYALPSSVITGLTTDFLPKWNGSVFGNSIVRELPRSLGIGITPFTWGGNSNSLRLGVLSSLSEQSSGTVNLTFGAYENGANTFAYTTTGDSPSQYSINGFFHSWSTASAGTAGNTFSFTERMRLLANGRLLIGSTTDNGVDHLQVAGSASFSGAVKASEALINDNGTVHWNGGAGSLTASLYGSGSGKYIDVWIDVVQKARFDINGLTVNGTISASPAVNSNQVVVKSQLDAFVPSGTVNLTGNQTIAGVKTFSSPVVVPNGVGVTDAVNKSQLDLKAGLASPTFTGTPTAPTATAGTNTTQVATTAFVGSAIATSDAGNVKTTGDQFNILGKKSFTSTTGYSIRVSNSSSVDGIQTLSASNGNGIFAEITGTGTSIKSNVTSGNGNGIVSNVSTIATGLNYVGQNNGTNTFTVDKLGAVTATSFIKSGASTTNLLLAGGGDIAQSTFAPAITGLTTNILPKWNGSGFGNSIVSEVGSEVIVNGSGFFVGGISIIPGALTIPLTTASQLFLSCFGADKKLHIGDGTGYNFSFVKKSAGIETIIVKINDIGNSIDVNGTITASPAVNSNQVVVLSQINGKANADGSNSSGTWGINITGNSGSSNLLNSLGNYVWNSSTQAVSYPLGVQASFVQGGDGFPNYGSVLNVNTYSGGGGMFQLYGAYGSGFGGNQLWFRNSDYSASGAWTGWKVLLDSSNFSSYVSGAYLPLTGGSVSGSIDVNGTITASPAVNSNQVVVKSQLDALAVGIGASGTWGINVTGRANKLYAFDSGNDVFWGWDGKLTMMINSTSFGRAIPMDITGNAARAQRANGNFYIDDNFGNTIVGVYTSDRYQGIYAMGDAFKLSADGTSTGSLYGLAWTHTNVGGQSKPTLSHQLLVVQAGVTRTAIGTGIWTSGGITIESGGSGLGLRMDYAPSGRTHLSTLTVGDGYGVVYYQGSAGRDGLDSVDIVFNTTTSSTSAFSFKTNGEFKAASSIYSPALYDSGSRVAISRAEGRNYIDYARLIYNNGAYSGSGWVEPSDLGVRYANSAGSAPNGSNNNLNYNVTAGDGNGIKFWGGSSIYSISMGVNYSYIYGTVTDYSIKMAMGAGAGRGFTWGQDGVVPIASLNSTSGNMQIAGSMTAPAFYQSSDIRLKNIVSRDGDVVKFKWRDGRDSKLHTGYIAQEVQENNPDQVNFDDKESMTVNYVEILVDKVRRLENELNKLRNEFK